MRIDSIIMEKKLIIPREGYLQQLESWKDRTDVAKIITGIRRCGKSTLMMQYIESLKDSGVDENDIIYLNLESGVAEDIADFKDLNEYLRERLNKDGRTYVLLDEVQRVKEWERSLNSLMVDHDADVYITGSNAYLLSSELSTYISGRYVEVHMLPLSFAEYLKLHPTNPDDSLDSRFSEYIWSGSLPMAYPDDPNTKDLLRGIYSTIIRKDVSARLEIRDIRQLDEITMFLFSNIGSVTSSSSIAKYTGMSPTTVKRYIQALEDAFIVYKTYRYDIRGKKHLSTLEKYYVADTGIRNAMLENAAGNDISRQIENIVYLELKRRGFNVSVGSYKDHEIDFTAEKNGELQYIQVTQTMMAESTFEREVRSLKDIRDSFPKMILTLDRIFSRAPDGIAVKNLIDWLLGK